uniref:TGF-beta family profile domain-containing protein n=1 Tax=Prolemur simus TaxID=1328070 RepID=A0A8C8ZEV3_PROSS
MVLSVLRILVLWELVLFIDHRAELAKVGQPDVPILAEDPSWPLVRELLEEAPGKQQRKPQLQGPQLQYMLKLYQSSADSLGNPREKRSIGATMVALVRPSANAAEPLRGPWHLRTLDFPFTGNQTAHRLVRATLVYPEQIYIDRFHFSCHVEPGFRKSQTNHFPPSGGGCSRPSVISESWTERDITEEVWQGFWNHTGQSFWNHTGPRVLRLHFLCHQENGSRGIEQPWTDGLSLDLAFLLVYINETYTSVQNAQSSSRILDESEEGEFPLLLGRTRRAASITSQLPGSSRERNSHGNDLCSLHRFQVSFRQLGWDHWIIAPHHYSPNYCKGVCPRVLPYGLNSPNHAIIQSLVNEFVDQSVPRPSCVPYKFVPLSVLLIGPNGNILYKEYEGMIVHSCTCR